ncbi:MAG TPA: glutamate-cysteine ligase family protein [Polyangiaceae bacterium]|nr:glutamate-cysteine ligase family protein [Polyangiaceae bacterium]
MMKSTADDERALVKRSELSQLFHQSEKPREAFRIGGEAEKIGVHAPGGTPLAYEGSKGVERLFSYLVSERGWHPERETESGPIIALTRGAASITLEPGAQFELSGAPHEDVHAVDREMREHLVELQEVSREIGLTWLGVGFHPIATQADLPWVPKRRYSVMKRYLPERGARGLDMMRRTATVQANFDYSSEADAMKKVVVLSKLAPIIHAMTANSPFYEGRVSERKSERGDVWLHMDPSRSGLVPAVAGKKNPTYEDYVEWALDAGMFLFRRGDTFVLNTGQTFRDFLANGFEGHRATFSDWQLHVNTLFPEARLKRTIEMRACDMLPERLLGSVPALLTGIVYDETSLDLAAELAETLSVADLEAARPSLVTRGLRANVGSTSAQSLALRVLEIAEAGLRRRAKTDASGRDETVFLAPLAEIVQRGECPADELTRGLSPGARVPADDLIRRTHI